MLYVLGDAFSSGLKGSQTSADHAAVSTDPFVFFCGRFGSVAPAVRVWMVASTQSSWHDRCSLVGRVFRVRECAFASALDVVGHHLLTLVAYSLPRPTESYSVQAF